MAKYLVKDDAWFPGARGHVYEGDIRDGLFRTWERPAWPGGLYFPEESVELITEPATKVSVVHEVRNVEVEETQVVKVWKQVEEKTIVLRLTEDEAQFLRDITNAIGGDPGRSRRKHSNSIRDALEQVDYSPSYDVFSKRDFQGNIIFDDTESAA